jgi:cardiolipin synthase
MNRRDIPNLICVIRIILVLPVVLLILNEMYLWAMAVFMLAGVSDGVDGYLAKHNNWQSRLGSILDPLADKLLLVSTYITLTWMGLIPLWLLMVVLARDIIIVIGAYVYHRFIGEFKMAPSLISKLNTVMQILLVMAILSLPLTAIIKSDIEYIVVATLLTTILSGLDYIVVWGRKAYRATHMKHNAHD